MKNLTNLIHLENNQLFTNSLDVSKTFDKRHADILRTITNLDCTKEFTERNFALSSYIDTTGRQLVSYNITRDGLVFLIMGFTGKKAAEFKEAYINAFNEMENKLKYEHEKESKKLLKNEKLRSGSYKRMYHEERTRADKLESDLIFNYQQSCEDRSKGIYIPNIEPRNEYSPMYLMSNKTNLDNLIRSMKDYGVNVHEHIKELNAIKLYFSIYLEESRRYSNLAAQLAHETKNISKVIHSRDITSQI